MYGAQHEYRTADMWLGEVTVWGLAGEIMMVLLVVLMIIFWCRSRKKKVRGRASSSEWMRARADHSHTYKDRKKTAAPPNTLQRAGSDGAERRRTPPEERTVAAGSQKEPSQRRRRIPRSKSEPEHQFQVCQEVGVVVGTCCQLHLCFVSFLDY